MNFNNNKAIFKFLNPYIAPLLSMAFLICSSAPFLSYISVKLQLAGFSDKLIGIVQSSFYLGYLIGSIKTEKLIRRIGYIRSFVFFAALFGATILIQGKFINFWIWTLMRIVAGISIAALYIVIESWFLSSSSSNTRGRVLSLYMIAVYISQAFSQMILKVISFEDLGAFLIFGIFCFLSIIPLSINYSKTPETSSEHIKKSILELYKTAPSSFWGSFISGTILSSIYSFLPIFAKLNNFEVSYMMTITIAGGFILQWPIGYLSDLFDRRKVLIINCLLLIIPSILSIFFIKSAATSYFLCMLLGGFSFVIYPISINQACDKLDVKYIPFVAGIMSVLYGIGATIGPFLTSLFMTKFSFGIFIYIPIMALILASAAMYFKLKLPKLVPKEEKSEFMPVSGSTPISSDLASQAIDKTKESSENPK